MWTPERLTKVTWSLFSQGRQAISKLARWSVVLMMSGSCWANTATAPDHIRDEIPQARLLGQGSYTWFSLKIYDAGLWVGEGGYQSGSAAQSKFVLDLRYARNLDGEQIAEASVKEMQKLGMGSAQQHQVWLAKMKGIFPDVKEGTHIAGVYLPGQGARFYLDGKLLGEVLDPEFAKAFFAIWLDPKSSDGQLRRALLAEVAR